MQRKIIPLTKEGLMTHFALRTINEIDMGALATFTGGTLIFFDSAPLVTNVAFYREKGCIGFEYLRMNILAGKVIVDEFMLNLDSTEKESAVKIMFFISQDT